MMIYYLHVSELGILLFLVFAVLDFLAFGSEWSGYFSNEVVEG